MCVFSEGRFKVFYLFYYLLQNESFDHRSFINFMSDGSMLLSSFFMLCLLEIRDIYYTCMQFLWCCNATTVACSLIKKEIPQKFINLKIYLIQTTPNYILFFGAVVVVCFTATATSHPCLHTIFASI